MKRLIQSSIVSVACALFAMFFGAGNIFLPLDLGRTSGATAYYAMIGFFITAAFLPLLGIVAAVLFDGDYRAFLRRIGDVPGTILMFLCFILVGPFYIIPRCITLSYDAIKWALPQYDFPYSQLIFVFIVCMLLFEATRKPSRIVDILGRVLAPLKILLLCAVIVKGIIFHPALPVCTTPGWASFFRGLTEGYGTLDLIAAIVFASLILPTIKRAAGAEHGPVDHKKVVMMAAKAGFIGALLLGAVYAGLLSVAAFNASAISCVPRAQLLSALAGIILGGGGGVLASVAVAFACLTTAIAVTAVFTRYLNRELFTGRVSYIYCLWITLVIAFTLANLGFEGLVNLVAPLVELVYPAMIVLAICNIAYKLFGFRPVKVPFFVTLLITIFIKFHA
jgi:LIVCS family branched-chain amino acid:cation transporter